MSRFQKARRSLHYPKLLITGMSGAGKTVTALKAGEEFAKNFAPELGLGPNILLLDTEGGSPQQYSPANDSEKSNPDNNIFDFFLEPMEEPYDLGKFAKFLRELKGIIKEEGISVVIIDSLSHWWFGVGGALSERDTLAKSTKYNSYSAFAVVKPKIRKVVEAIIDLDCAVFVTLREKHEYEEIEKTKATGAKFKTYERVGSKAQFDQDAVYDFDIALQMQRGAVMVVDKTRYSPWFGLTVVEPDGDFFAQYFRHLATGSADDQDDELANKYRYQDGTFAETSAEKGIFGEYAAAHDDARPESADALRAWYKETRTKEKAGAAS